MTALWQAVQASEHCHWPTGDRHFTTLPLSLQPPQWVLMQASCTSQQPPFASPPEKMPRLQDTRPGVTSMSSQPALLPVSPVPGSALQMNPGWDTLEWLDRAMLDAAWRLGAWELDREARRGCRTAGASDREALECRQAFGAPLFGDDGDDFMLAEAPDRPQMLELGERVGYVHWRFRPVRGGVWRDTARDDTLGGDGGRAPPCPVHAAAGPGAGRVRYMLGRVEPAGAA